MSTGKKLVELRGDRSRKEIANAVGVTPSAIAMYERDARIPKDEIKKKFASYYGKTVEEIFYS